MDLNEAAEYFIKESDLDALKQCVKYSLQPEKVLQCIFDTKRYECLPSVLPFLHALFQLDKRQELGVAILLDLLERKEPLPQIQNMDLNFFMEQAVERKLLIDFAQNDFLDCEPYYIAILQKDCVELFTALREEILQTVDTYDFYLIVSDYGAALIFEAASFRAEGFGVCFYSLLSNYAKSFCHSLPSQKRHEHTLRHVLCNGSFQDQIDRVSYDLEKSNDAERLAALLRIGFQMNSARKQDIQRNNPELSAQLFAEDV